MSLVLKLLLVLVCVVYTDFSIAHARSDSPRVIKVGVGVEGSALQTFGESLVASLNVLVDQVIYQPVALTNEDKLSVMLDSGALDMALHSGYATSKLDSKAIFVLFPNPVVLAVNASSHIQSIEDLKNKSIIVGDFSSPEHRVLEYVLASMGFNITRDYKPVFSNNRDSYLLLNGHVEAIWGFGGFWPGVVDNPDIRILELPIQRIKSLADGITFTMMGIQRPYKRGRAGQAASLGRWARILVSKRLDESSVYALTRSVNSVGTLLAGSFPVAKYMKDHVTLARINNDDIHMGALRYFNKQGMTQHMCY